MSPTEFRPTLRALGLSAREFARLTGIHEETVYGWGTTRSGKLQEVPLWAWRLLAAWSEEPKALQGAQRAP